MATTRLNLTRDQLATFLKDHEQIRQFERLFERVDVTVPSSLEEVSILSATADAKATAALTEAHILADLVEGLLSAPPAREFKRTRYGQFYDTTTQTAAAINTATAMTYNTTDLTSGIRIRSPSTSQIEVDTEGVYNVQFSAQLDNTSGGNHTAWIWLRVNGIDVPQSASRVVIKSTDGDLVAAWNWFYVFKPLDYFEIMWAVSDTAVQLVAAAAAAPIPGIPSVILTVSNNIQGVQ